MPVWPPLEPAPPLGSDIECAAREAKEERRPCAQGPPRQAGPPTPRSTVMSSRRQLVHAGKLGEARKGGRVEGRWTRTCVLHSPRVIHGASASPGWSKGGCPTAGVTPRPPLRVSVSVAHGCALHLSNGEAGRNARGADRRAFSPRGISLVGPRGNKQARPSRPEFRQKRWPTHPRRPSARAPMRRCHRLPSCLTSRPRLQRAARAAAAAPAQRSSPRWMMCWPPSHHRPRVGRPPRRLRALQPRRSKSSLGLHLACSP